MDRGFLPQASELERSTRTNLTELANSVTRAADSVLGSQADALRYAQTELDDLSRQLEREIKGSTNTIENATGATGGARGQSNHLARTEERISAENPQNGQSQGETAGGNNAGRNERDGGNGQIASNTSPNQAPGSTPSQAGEQAKNGETQNEAGGTDGGTGTACGKLPNRWAGATGRWATVGRSPATIMRPGPSNYATWKACWTRRICAINWPQFETGWAHCGRNIGMAGGCPRPK